MPTTQWLNELLDRMTLEEKAAQMDMIRGVPLATRPHPAHFCAVSDDSDFDFARVARDIGANGIGFVHDVYGKPAVLNRLQRYLVEQTRLGIPAIFTGEALHGLIYPGATSFPMPIGWASAFDPELTGEIGAAIAAECRALGIHEILSPNLDVARDPRWGRVEETFGEDTYLACQMARALITGEQGACVNAPDKVVCEPKHYLAHGVPEGGLNCAPAHVGAREVLSEYLPVFETAVQDAGAYCAMAAYHSVDGTPLIASHHYLTDILKNKLGLRGYIRADFGAVYRLRHAHHMTECDMDAIALAVNAGLDVQGFDYANDVWQSAIVALVRQGRVPMARVDDAVRRVLRVKADLGLFEHPYTDETKWRGVVRSPKHHQLALRAAREGMVLLKNDGVLPLQASVRSVAVIGPSSGRQRLGSYASVPYGYHVQSVFEALGALLPPSVALWQEDGCGISERDDLPVPDAWLPGGVEMTFFADGDFTRPPVGTDHATGIHFNWMLAKPHAALPFGGFGVRLRGTLCADRDFDGDLVLACGENARLRMDGQTLLDSKHGDASGTAATPYHFEAGKARAFEIEYVKTGDGRSVTLAYSAHTAESMNRAVELARKADVTVVVCGDDTITSGEGMDRNELTLYGPQRELIARAARACAHTVLVLEAGKPVDLMREEPLVSAVLLPWFGGEHGAQAIAEALLGHIDPSGRLPVSFPQSVGCLPCYYSRLPGGSPAYLEGANRPRYPFGYGLSYTKFELNHLTACVTENGAAQAVCVLSNVGGRAGCAVVQLYVEDPVSSVVTPDRRLCAFERVTLQAGESRRVIFSLPASAFMLMNQAQNWVVEPGEFRLHAGFSCEDIRASVSLNVS